MDRPIRVLFLTHNYPRFDGDFSGVFLHVLAKSLLPHNIQPVILAPHDAGIPEREERDGIPIVRFRYDSDDRETLAYRGNMQDQVFATNPIRSLEGMFGFRRFLGRFEDAARATIEETHPELLWGHWVMPAGIIVKWLGGKTSIPCLLSSHGTDVRLLKRFRKFPWTYLRPMLPRVHAWTVVSEHLKQELLSLDRSLESKIRVLPLPHDESIFFPVPSVVREHNRIVAVTRFTEQKRVGVLVDAFARLKKDQPTASLDIWGSGPLQTQIEFQIQQLGVVRDVTIHAPVSQRELADIYRRAGIVVLNSVDEGFGLALSEAMLCGAPVVGVASGGITDIISDGVTGLLARPDDAADLADKILLLLGDQSLRTRLAEAGQQSAYERYASGPLSAMYSRLIRDAIPQK